MTLPDDNTILNSPNLDPHTTPDNRPYSEPYYVSKPSLEDNVNDFISRNDLEEASRAPAPIVRTGVITGGLASDELPGVDRKGPRRDRGDTRNGGPRSDRGDHRSNPREKTGALIQGASAGINPNGTFFITEGKQRGGMKMNWDRWSYDYDAANPDQINAVTVIFPNDRVRLTGKDAYNFLKIVGDRNSEIFSRASREQASN